MINEEIFVLSLPYSQNKNKTVRVYVPSHEEGETFPVIYMTDGQNLFEFEKDRGQLGSWFTHDAVKEEYNNNGKAAIIVGIHNDSTPMERTNELTPKNIGNFIFPPEMPEPVRKMLVPEGALFDEFILNTVMPAVEQRFPVKTGRNNTAFCGSSSGGLFSFFTVLSHPEIFSYGGVFSPVFIMYDRNDLEKWIRCTIQDINDLPYLYMYMGGADDMEKLLDVQFEWVCGLLENCYPHKQLFKKVMPEQKHHENAWEINFRAFLHKFLTQQ